MPLPQKTSSPLRRAFTLIELMVVIAIIIIIVAVSVPALKALTKGNDTAQATSMLSSLIANARSTAISNGSYAAVIFYEANNGKEAQTSAIFAVEDRASTTSAAVYLLPAGNTTVQRLPSGSRVSAVDSTGVFAVQTDATSTPRIILFDNLGQLSFQSNIRLSPLTTSTTPPISQNSVNILAQWNTDFHGTGPWSSTPALVLYSQTQLTSDAPPDTNQWLLQHAKVLVVNAYTGTVIQ